MAAMWLISPRCTYRHDKPQIFVPTMLFSEFLLPTSNDSTVTISLLHCGSMIIDTKILFHNSIPGHNTAAVPFFSFLIENNNVEKKVLFDLGLMKGWKEKLPPRSGSIFSNRMISLLICPYSHQANRGSRASRKRQTWRCRSTHSCVHFARVHQLNYLESPSPWPHRRSLTVP